MKDLVKVKSFISKCYNQDDGIPYCWYNLNRIIDSEDIKSLQNYLNNRKELEYLLIASGIEETRPQRTVCTLPEFFRPSSYICYYDEHKRNNTFIFAISKSNPEWMEYEEKDIINLKNEFPDKATITILKKDINSKIV